MYAISPYEDGEYSGGFDTLEEAITEGRAIFDDYFWVGKVVPPKQPEAFFTREQLVHWLETVGENDDYGGDWAEDWYGGTKEQETELVEQLRGVITSWLDKHNLRPKHFVIEAPQRIDCESPPSATKRIDSEGRDVTDLPGLWDESDKTENL